MSNELQPLFFRYYGGQDEHQQEAVLRHEVEGRSGEVSFYIAEIFSLLGICHCFHVSSFRHFKPLAYIVFFFRYPLRLGMF